jgi:hypothetical protein
VQDRIGINLVRWRRRDGGSERRRTRAATWHRRPRRGTRGCHAAWLAVVTLLVGCGTGPGIGGPAGDVVTATVGPAGGVVFGPDGMALGVPAGTLSETISVTLARVTPPTAALHDGVDWVGSAYRVSASTDVFTDATERGFIVGLPVPEGVDPGGLALALFMNVEHVLDVEEDGWYFVPGHHDPELRLLLAHAPVLLEEGDVVRLVRGPFSSPPVPPSPAAAVRPAFVSTCLGWFDEFEVQAGPGITPATAALAKAHLDSALDLYKTLGFQPFLLRTTGWLPYLSAESATFLAESCSDVKYLAAVELPIYGPNIRGSYSASQQTMSVYTSNTDTDEIRVAAFHELFHSIQARSLGTSEMRVHARAYFIEGTAALTAALAEAPPELDVTRAPYWGRRLVDVTLLAPKASGAPNALWPYEVQDFWAFVATKHGMPFHTFMLPFLGTGGAAPAAVDGVLKQAPFTSSLAEQYGEWVIDQVFDLESCTFASHVVDALQDLGAVSVQDDGVVALPAPLQVSRDHLNTRVVKVAVDDGTDQEPFQLAIRVEDEWADLDEPAVAVIQKRSTPVSCTVYRADAFETTGGTDGYAYLRLDVSDGRIDEFYVLLANGSFEAARSGRLMLDPAPAITGDVSASPQSIGAETATVTTFEIPFDDRGENLKRLSVTVELGGVIEANFGLDVEESDLTSGFDGPTGTGLFTPEVVVYCSEAGRNPLTLTFQLVDELDFVSQEKSASLTVDYGSCP